MSKEEVDFYEVLCVSRSATDAELKKSYRKLARELHPDANPGDKEAEEKFKRVTLAYEVLKDPQRRAAYDQFGIDGVRGAGSSGGSDPFGFGMNLNDLFDAFFQGGGFGSTGRGYESRGRDYETQVELEFEQAVFGESVDVPLRLPVRCDTCNTTGAKPGTLPVECKNCGGLGEVRSVRRSILGQMVSTSACPDCQGMGSQIPDPCPDCRGEGAVTKQINVKVDVPAGVESGQTLRVTGKGAAGRRGVSPGDLYVHLLVKSSSKFTRQGDDIYIDAAISMSQAALGTKIMVDTLDGTEEINVEKGTQNGKKLVLRSKGVPKLSGTGRGNAIVVFSVETPTDLTEEQTVLLSQFAAMRNEKIVEVDKNMFDKFRDAFRS